MVGCRVVVVDVGVYVREQVLHSISQENYKTRMLTYRRTVS